MSYALRARPAPTRTSSATKSRRSNSETPSSPASAQSTPEDDWKDPAPRSSPERKRKESTAKGEDKPPVEKRAKVEMTVQRESRGIDWEVFRADRNVHCSACYDGWAVDQSRFRSPRNSNSGSNMLQSFRHSARNETRSYEWSVISSSRRLSADVVP